MTTFMYARDRTKCQISKLWCGVYKNANAIMPAPGVGFRTINIIGLLTKFTTPSALLRRSSKDKTSIARHRSAAILYYCVFFFPCSLAAGHSATIAIDLTRQKLCNSTPVPPTRCLFDLLGPSVVSLCQEAYVFAWITSSDLLKLGAFQRFFETATLCRYSHRHGLAIFKNFKFWISEIFQRISDSKIRCCTWKEGSGVRPQGDPRSDLRSNPESSQSWRNTENFFGKTSQKLSSPTLPWGKVP